jgi:hypothetical protein
MCGKEKDTSERPTSRGTRWCLQRNILLAKEVSAIGHRMLTPLLQRTAGVPTCALLLDAAALTAALPIHLPNSIKDTD